MNSMSSSKENAIAYAGKATGYQVEVVSNFLEGHDVFGVFPTGYGKSLSFFSCLPYIFDIYLE